ncbi:MULTISPECIES: N-acyl homoserine lactonase family protein [unclassified Actinomyces]|uniref:N-acyl homoserine lactonase family protein n=1 Tax=unclassified Actinomyces TaxID=2609248 RepID=UPI002017A801|nr:MULTISPECIES: N-acyl homoserine lactonase family protein [unclassified Actinomyces]MCL3776874.1 N-acyl homoserine lactonase family protein [Actinomyces sp. AC-20-1]MCL3790383.1 N-acyl homoserine lactonase family protein [Actinomyces sp. 187325]MCL3792811.1 N-acyl homoserine lactonase family protein [Actinomyces sp. 186855]MCL3795271.1 N-acyl homoserine lactonase family protein [Actinomyces sp. 217892]
MSTSLTVLRTGTVVVDEALPYHRATDRPLAWTHAGRSRRHLIEAPVSCYLIENRHGLTLIDSGWHAGNRDRAWQVANLRQQYPVNKAVLPDGEAIHEQLEERGLRPQDLDLVLLSHLHCDHADGLRHLAGAPRVLVSAPELSAASRDRLRYLPHEWKGVDVGTFLWDTQVGPFGAGWDVFGDGDLVMVHVPGHAWGLCATLVRGDVTTEGDDAERAGWVGGVDAPGREDPRAFHLLTSDVGYGRPSFDEGLRPGVVVDAGLAEHSLAWVRAVESDPRCLGLMANHDPEVRPGARVF